MKIIETFELVADGRELYVTVRVENNYLHRPITIRKVYDAIRPPN